jgi:Histone methylation protein DOT1
MHGILCAMRDVTEEWAKLGPGSTFVDIGSGLGRPLLHAMVTIGVKATFGIECDKVKVRGWYCNLFVLLTILPVNLTSYPLPLTEQVGKAISFTRITMEKSLAEGLDLLRVSGSPPVFHCSTLEAVRTYILYNVPLRVCVPILCTYVCVYVRMCVPICVQVKEPYTIP